MPASKEEKLRRLEAEAKDCTLCRLNEGRSNVVFGAGPADAKIMLLGEAPGRTEDRTKIPFSGSAGKFLDKLLQEAGMKREKVYITNVVMSRPPNNRKPLPDEIALCRPFLKGKISIIKPKFVVSLGATAAEELLGRPVVIGKEHGTLQDCEYGGVKFKLFVSYHPAAALYGGQTRLMLLEDFKKLGQIAGKV